MPMMCDAVDTIETKYTPHPHICQKQTTSDNTLTILWIKACRYETFSIFDEFIHDFRTTIQYCWMDVVHEQQIQTLYKNVCSDCWMP